MSTAQESFAAMLREDLAPRLRKLGFKGSGQSYSIPSDRHWINIGFQKGTWSNSDLIAFTMNVTVADKAMWAQMRQERSYLPAKPAPNIVYGSFAWQRRIGQLLPGGQDQWWELRANSGDSERIAALVAAAVHDYVLPAIESEVAGQT
jgi:hypothetical protein